MIRTKFLCSIELLQVSGTMAGGSIGGQFFVENPKFTLFLKLLLVFVHLFDVSFMSIFVQILYFPYKFISYYTWGTCGFRYFYFSLLG